MTKVFLLLALAVTALSPNAARAEDPEIKVQYKIGDGLYIGDGVANSVHLQGRVQTRLTHSILENALNTTTFSVPRAEIRIDGFTYNKKIKFGFEMNLATRTAATTRAVCATPACASTVNVISAESTSGVAVMNDYFIDWTPTTYFGVQSGQFKVPFLEQQLTSSTKQQFVDRSISTTAFDFSRDIGMNVHGGFTDDKLLYNVFVMNGDGANSFNRNKQNMLIGTRIEGSILGKYKPSEADVDNSQTPNLGAGVAVALNQRSSAIQSSTIPAYKQAVSTTFDVGYKYKGLSIQNAEMLTRKTEGTNLTNWGWNTQVGYFVKPKKVEVAVKQGGVIYSNATVNQYEYAAGVNYYVKGHGIKFQTDYTLLANSGGVQNKNDHVVRAAMNLIF